MINNFIFSFFTCCISVFSMAQSQFLDHSFGLNGVQTYTPNSTYPFMYDTGAITSQDKIIVTGSYLTPSSIPSSVRTNIVQRLNSDGSIDNSFNTFSIVTGFQDLYFSQISIQPDNKILLGEFGFRYLTRLNENGTLDFGFGNNGQMNDGAISMILSDRGLSSSQLNKIVSIGNKILLCFDATDEQQNYKIGVLRLNDNGTVDNSFGNNGVIIEDGSSGQMIVQNNSKLILISQDLQTLAIHKSRYSLDGILDGTFNNNLLQYTMPPGYMTYLAKAVGKNNNVFIYGVSSPASGPVPLITLIKIDQNGEIDHSFGVSGVANEQYYSTNNYTVYNNTPFQNLLIDNDNNLLVVCSVSPTMSPLNYNQFIKKFNSSGAVDQSFGNNGTVDIDLNSSEYVRKAIITNDNKIMIFGYNSSPNKGVITKILNNSNTLTTENLIKQDFKISPNPVENFIHLNNQKNNKIITAEIMDFSGRILLTTKIDNNTIDVTSIQKGVYYLKIGNIITKFIKK
ncbi:putative delta-60 repeat protein [Chryseobacterium sp. H1D6B]|nr:putative delta-60 repeat protein [Chryseobacterium sp. H1D6B]